MSPTKRRTFISSLGAAAIGSVAGCATSADGDPPGGSLQFTNQDALPHSLQLSVTNVGSELDNGTVIGEVTVPAQQRDLTTTEQLSPEDTTTYTDVFIEPVWYVVECTVDGRQTSDREGIAQVTFHPAPPGREYVNYLQALLSDSGRVELAVVTTENTGRDTPDVSE